MLLIDKTKESQIIILTLDGVFFIPTLYIQNDATREEFEIELGDNLSFFTERYDKFIVPFDQFEGMSDGYYSYTIKGAVLNDIIETGKLLVLPTPATQIPSVSEEEDTVLVFTK